MKKTTSLLAILALSLLFAFSGNAQAHTLWINLSDHAPVPYGSMGASTKAYFGWGHRYPVDDFLTMDDLNLYAYVDPQGQQHELAPKSEGFMAERITLKDEGAYYVFAEKKPGFYTMYEEDGRIHHKMGTMEGCSNVVLSLYYEEYAKALVTVGQPNNDAMTKPVGHALEIVPLQNPMSLKQGDLLQVQVLFNGQPARFCEVLATYQGFSSEDDFAFATIANGKGIATIRLLHHGPWLVKVKKKTAPEEELQGKCLEHSYSATLTFAVP